VWSRAEPGPQSVTHFDASTRQMRLKTHLVAASFILPQHFLLRKMRHSSLGLDAPDHLTVTNGISLSANTIKLLNFFL